MPPSSPSFWLVEIKKIQIFCVVNLEWGGGAGSDGGGCDYKALYKTHKVNRF